MWNWIVGRQKGKKLPKSLEVWEIVCIFAALLHNNIIMNASVVNSIREYFKTKPVEKAWVFGSFSRNEEREDSDIDIMVELSPDARMGLSYFAMICDLEDRLNRRVDMVREGQLLPFAIESANRDKILVYERNR